MTDIHILWLLLAVQSAAIAWLAITLISNRSLVREIHLQLSLMGGSMASHSMTRGPEIHKLHEDLLPAGSYAIVSVSSAVVGSGCGTEIAVTSGSVRSSQTDMFDRERRSTFLVS